MEPTVSKMK